jgi:hypothetical protein
VLHSHTPTLTRNERTVRAVGAFLAFTNCLLIGDWVTRTVDVDTRFKPDMVESDSSAHVINKPVRDAPGRITCEIEVKGSSLDLFEFPCGRYDTGTIRKRYLLASLVVFAVLLAGLFRGIQLGIRALFAAEADPDASD